MYKALLISVLCFACIFANAQTYVVYQGDTINFTDNTGLKKGYWIVFKDNSETIIQEGNYKEGQKEGIWTTYYNDGTKKSEITYTGGEKSGYAKIYFENGSVAEEGTWDRDKWVGNYKSYFQNGTLSYLWNYNEEGNRCGYQQYFHENGIIKIEGEWANGKEKGIIRAYYSSGELKDERHFKEGSIQLSNVDENSDIDTNSNITEIFIGDLNTPDSFKNKNPEIFQGNGQYIFYNKDRKVEKEGFFSNGLLIKGKHYLYDDYGNLKKTLIYDQGQITEEKSVEIYK